MIPMEHASAAGDLVRIVTSLSRPEPPPKARRLRSSRSSPTTAPTASCSWSGERSQRLRFRTLITHLDTPLEAGGDTQVRLPAATPTPRRSRRRCGAAAGHRAAAGRPGGRWWPAAAPAAATGQGERDHDLGRARDQLAGVTAPPKIMRSVTAIVDRLDIRRAQVWSRRSSSRCRPTRRWTARRELGGRRRRQSAGLADSCRLSPARVSGRSSPGAARGGNGGDDGTTTVTPPTGLTLGFGEINENGTSWAG